jgi:hypothetical protein
VRGAGSGRGEEVSILSRPSRVRFSDGLTSDGLTTRSGGSS